MLLIQVNLSDYPHLDDEGNDTSTNCNHSCDAADPAPSLAILPFVETEHNPGNQYTECTDDGDKICSKMGKQDRIYKGV